MPATLSIGIISQLAKAADIGEVSHLLRQTYQHALGDGTADGQYDQVFVDTFSIAASGSASLDLKGSMTDVFGNAFTPAEIAAIIIYADAANVNNIVVGNDTNAIPIFSAATASIAVRPGSLFLITAGAAGIAVTASTGDILKLSNSGSGTSVAGGIIILARSA